MFILLKPPGDPNKESFSNLRPVALRGQPLVELGDRLPPRLWIFSTHKNRLVELQQSWKPKGWTK